jgi:hypothetical protein
MTKIIEVIVSPSGETRLETKGFAGSSCQAASQFLEKALGLRQSEQLTAEFHAEQTNQHLLQEGRP